jgi:ATP-dependent exoDNAse (exonuclease V) alpha subunit
MADYHFNVTQIKRSAGQSAVASAAYRAGEKLHSEFYGEDSDYTHKNGVVFSDILLPSHVPKEYADREFLWNSVEKAEKHPKAQLAYSFDFSLQNEFSMEENLAIAREFIQKNFVDRGMIADYAVHLPERTDGGEPNPHVHVMCPIRPMEPDGTWGAKQHRVYRLDEDGNRIRDSDGNFLFDARPTTDWGTPETLEQWRTAWAEINNAHFAERGLDTRLDNRSFERQGIDLLPTIHEGPNVREMERRGIRTAKGDRNRWIRSLNAMVKSLGVKLSALLDWITELNAKLHEKPEPSVVELLTKHLNQRNEKAWSFVAKKNNLKEHAKLVSYLQEHEIYSMDDLSEHIRQVNEKGAPVQLRMTQLRNRLHTLDILEKAGERYAKTKPIYDEWYRIFFKKSKEKFSEEHKKELNTFHVSRKQLKNGGYLTNDGLFDAEKLDRDRENYLLMMEQLVEENKPLHEQVETLNAIRRAVSSIIDSDGQNRGHDPISDTQKAQEVSVHDQPKKSQKRNDYSL